ncbi:MAG: hypothetical protein GWN79_11605, partial [Actinobacteria bacterium]|nr:hypothetical protein [Actinomycetota bacterium]NIT96016.1 hypothetical protein [Actinomycetota bacterium]NIU19692.1 hypothetical protein [Actinomycetota bacterium]NIV56180.1 hypothetical protein [Actinomycetota bacterium]NIX51000.1 hypothetical protein [Actinomycetota bacterium]
MGWGKETRYLAALWSRGGSFGDQDFLVNDPPLQVFVVLAVLGAVVCGMRRIRFGMALTLVAMIIATAFVLLPETRLWNVRLLPFYYLTVYLLAGIAVAEVGRAAVGFWRGNAARASAVAAVPAVAVAAVLLVALAFPLRAVPFAGNFTRDGSTLYGFESIAGIDDLAGIDFGTTQLNFGPGWARYNFSGYENKPGTAEYTDFVATMEQVGEQFGCGQSLWEFESERLGSYGTTMALMLLPHWTDGCIGSMEGLYFEASATTPYHFLLQSELSAAPSRAQRDLPYSPLDVEKGVAGMRTLGVRYYMAFSEGALTQARAHPALEEIAASGPWVIFQLFDHQLVSGLDHLPVVVDGIGAGGEEWLVPSVAHWEAGAGTPLLAADGPAEWPRQSLEDLDLGVHADRSAEIRSLAAELPDWVERVAVEEPAVVTGVHTDNSSIAFRVDRVGAPVLVRTSYFPNWDADGAEGPY